MKKDFHGAEMFWSHYGSKKNGELITTAGFDIILDEINSPGGEKHQVIMARKLNIPIDSKKITLFLN